MVRIRHPLAPDSVDGVPDDAVYINGDAVPINDDGMFEAPESWAKDYAERNGVSFASIRVGSDANTELCATEMSDGELCERPADECPYH